MIVLVPEATLAELAPRVAEREVRLVPYLEDGPLPAELGDAEAVFRWIAGTRYAELVEKGPRVRWLQTASAGLDHVLTDAIRAKPGLIVTDSGPAFSVSLPEFVLTWMLALTHRVPDFLEQQARRDWSWLRHDELSGKTVGVLGLGPIGRGVAQRCRALGMRTLGLRRHDTPCPAVDETLVGVDGLRRLVGESDWIVVAAALTGETRALLDADAFARLKPGAALVNVARGALIDTDALIAALTDGRLRAAVLDVTDPEPLPVDHPLWSTPGAYITMHSSGWTDGLRRRQLEWFVDNLRHFVRGEPLEAVADVTLGY